MNELVVDARNRLGECPLWCERSGTLYWTDIEGKTVSRLLADGEVRHWTLPQRVGSFALCEDGRRLLLGLASGIALFDMASEALSAVVPVEAEVPATRINDGRCDRQGRFVFGMFNSAEAAIGGFYRLHPDLRVERLPLPPAAVGNGIAFSPDGATMYYTDSPARTIWRLDYGDRLGKPEVFVRLSKQEGFADGSCVDADGGLWNAQWDGACVVRYDADGKESARLALPVGRPTCPAFGGPDFATLYVTSARGGLDKEALRAQPQAGGVFALATQWRGLPESRFDLSLSSRP
jgi:L-arabinonolactonase